MYFSKMIFFNVNQPYGSVSSLWVNVWSLGFLDYIQFFIYYLFYYNIFVTLLMICTIIYYSITDIFNLASSPDLLKEWEPHLTMYLGLSLPFGSLICYFHPGNSPAYSSITWLPFFLVFLFSISGFWGNKLKLSSIQLFHMACPITIFFLLKILQCLLILLLLPILYFFSLFSLLALYFTA